MIGNGPRNGFKVPQRDINNIRKAAFSVSEFFEVSENVRDMSMSSFLDGLAQYGIAYDVLDSEDMPTLGVEACCIPESLIICIRSDVFEKACNNEPRARFTIMHEFGHLILGHQRTINRDSSSTVQKTIEDSEWQADQFAAEFLMPYEVIKSHSLKTEEQIQTYFNVSPPAAYLRIKQLASRREI
jgi:IrrE N-terminal-like domain